MAHEFGGIWTQKKISVLREYLSFYVTALKNQPFTLHYADAFAGNGKHTPARHVNQQLFIDQEDFAGSVTAALEVRPGFDVYHFNDLSPAHHLELQRQEFCNGLNKSDRAVLLLDPYSTELNWNSMEYVAQSKQVDLWLLFPISVILRMTPTDGDRIRPEWKSTLDRLLGDSGWESSLYKPIESSPMLDLFDTPAPERTERINVQELELWVTSRLKHLFPFVAKPVLLTNNGSPLFLFYLAVSNPQRKAWGLAQKAASHIIEKFDDR